MRSAILLVLVSSSSAVEFPRSEKLSSRVVQTLVSSSPDAVVRLWLDIDSSAILPSPIHLTDKARARRAKVDPKGFLVDWYDCVIPTKVVTAIEQNGGTVQHVSRWLKAVSVEIRTSYVEQLALLPFVRKIDLVPTLRRPADPRVWPEVTTEGLTYGNSELQNRFVRADKLHQAGLNGRGVLITLIDSGFKNGHRAFDSTSIVATYDFINHQIAVDDPGCSSGSQQHVHGTLILGAIGGYVPDTLSGVAYGASFALAKTEITCSGVEIKIEEDNWIAAAEWADSLGADIISSSLGYTTFQDSGSYMRSQLDGNSSRITQAADIAASKNILVVVSAGNSRNDSWGTIGFPSDGDSVIAVGAVQSNGLYASFSSPGPSADGRVKPDITTLGVQVFTANAAGGYTWASGTSLSTPLVAGGAALAIQSDSTLTVGDLLELIRKSGDRALNPDYDYGYGLFDAVKTADIVSVVPIDSISLKVGKTASLPVTTSGRARSSSTITAFDLPAGGIFIDHGNGTGTLEVTATSGQVGRWRIGLVATAGLFVDTSYFVARFFDDIVAIMPLDSVVIEVGKSAIVAITTQGTSHDSAVLSAFDLPEGAVLTDSHDGTGTLEIQGIASQAGRRVVGLVASVGSASDTTYLVVITYIPGLRFGPNPFSDSVQIFIGLTSRPYRTATIFNIAGEKIWEKVNITGQPSDTIIKWDGFNSAGAKASAGVYIVHIVTDRGEALLKLLKTD